MEGQGQGGKRIEMDEGKGPVVGRQMMKAWSKGAEQTESRAYNIYKTPPQKKKGKKKTKQVTNI